jgi:hypothetical protein
VLTGFHFSIERLTGTASCPVFRAAFPPQESSVNWIYRTAVGVAQLVERRSVAPNVAGSIPVSHPNPLLQFFSYLPQNIISTSYFWKVRSAVNSTMFSARACAMSMRSNGSR